MSVSEAAFMMLFSVSAAPWIFTSYCFGCRGISTTRLFYNQFIDFLRTPASTTVNEISGRSFFSRSIPLFAFAAYVFGLVLQIRSLVHYQNFLEANIPHLMNKSLRNYDSKLVPQKSWILRIHLTFIYKIYARVISHDWQFDKNVFGFSQIQRSFHYLHDSL